MSEACDLKAGENGSYYSAYERLTKELLECCGENGSPLIPRIKRLITMFLQAHFGDAHNYGEYAETVNDLTYNVEDPSKSTLVVKPVHSYSPGDDDKQSGVFVEVVSSSSEKRVLGDYAGTSEDLSTDRLVLSKTTIVKIHCQTNDEEKSSILAETASDFLTAVRASLMESLHLSALEVAGCEPYKKKESPAPKGTFVWSVTLKLRHNHSIFVVTEGHRLKTFALELGFSAGQD